MGYSGSVTEAYGKRLSSMLACSGNERPSASMRGEDRLSKAVPASMKPNRTGLWPLVPCGDQ